MANEEEKANPLFVHLVLSLHSAAWYQMGKVVSPVTGKMEKNLDEARVSIDLLTMLQEKTKGNLLPDEKQYLDNTVYTLQMNYIDEVKSADNKDKDGADGDKEKPAGKTKPAGTDQASPPDREEGPEDGGEDK